MVILPCFFIRDNRSYWRYHPVPISESHEDSDAYFRCEGLPYRPYGRPRCRTYPRDRRGIPLDRESGCFAITGRIEKYRMFGLRYFSLPLKKVVKRMSIIQKFTKFCMSDITASEEIGSRSIERGPSSEYPCLPGEGRLEDRGGMKNVYLRLYSVQKVSRADGRREMTHFVSEGKSGFSVDLSYEIV